ncbi:succinylglutamate desuccinylase/aspartoacylase family protein [uncultured Litoreibacter sp.]|uniref:succinylglutamate desuccinylase/aspartoacylase domain-containing protein n=1 Tax=uncultured Litoreibacter sp. TaxID=1392394 RepID=UPI002617F106|nr:succinylglutamate desuccinylase/aspartoacylase family protein [uncultured Litoreibacter sp.]
MARNTFETAVYTDKFSAQYIRVLIDVPNIQPYAAGSHGVPYVWEKDSGKPGPHLMICGIMHGNEICGAHVIKRFLDRDVVPARGKVTYCFGNVDAYHRFDPENPQWHRFIDADINRIWGKELDDMSLQGSEHKRARELRPVIDRVDVLLDIHSFQCRGLPVANPGSRQSAIDLAQRIPHTPLVLSGPKQESDRIRLLDYERFSNPAHGAAALQIQVGHHWSPESVENGWQASLGFLDIHDMLPESLREDYNPDRQKLNLEVSELIYDYEPSFAFEGDYMNGEFFEKAGTLIATEGEREIRTPHDNTYLVMPVQYRRLGMTVGRFAREVPIE